MPQRHDDERLEQLDQDEADKRRRGCGRVEVARHVRAHTLPQGKEDAAPARHRLRCAAAGMKQGPAIGRTSLPPPMPQLQSEPGVRREGTEDPMHMCTCISAHA